jgi:hypothetical protein
VQLGRNRSRPRRTVCVAHACGVGSAHAHSACAARGHVGAQPTATRARPAFAGPASAGASHAARGARRLCPAAYGSAAALPREPVAARHRHKGDGGGGGSPAWRRRARDGGRLRSGRRGFRPRRLGRELSGQRRRARGDGRVARRCRERAVLSEAAR